VTATAILDLERAGFTREQVEALARLIETQTATKADLAAAKAELKADIAGLASELKLLEQRMTIRLGGIVVAVGAALGVFLRLLPGGHP
jgi:cell division protein FtsB